MLAIQQQEAPFGVSTECHAEFSIKTVGFNIQDVGKERSRIDAKLSGNSANLYKIGT